MRTRKIKLLIVNGSLAQAGNERWIYEICRAIDKEKFEVAVLCDKKYLQTEDTQNFGNYYYHELKNAGIRVYEYLDGKPKSGPISHFIYRAKRLARHLMGKPKTKISSQITSLLRESDVIGLIDFYNYAALKDAIHKHCEDKFFIVLHSHKIQFDYDPYVWFEKDLSYRFTYACPKQVTEIESSGLSLEKNSFFFNPLILDLSGYSNLFNPINGDTLIFSVFARIAPTKPIDKLIRSFAKIREQMPHNSILNIYGELQDEDYYRQLQQLILDLEIDAAAVRFMGHSMDMVESIKNDGVNVYWGLGMNANFGYASIEIGAMGVPSFFWNLDESTDFRTVLEQTDNLMMVHNSIDDFVSDNVRYANDNDLLSDLSAKQRKFFIDRHDIGAKIKDFEEYVISIDNSAQSANTK